MADIWYRLLSFVLPGFKHAAWWKAVAVGDIGRIQKQLERSPELVNLFDKNECTALHYSAQHGRLKVIEFLLDAGATVDARQTGADASGLTPLHLAAWHQQTEAVQMLLNREAKVNLRARVDWNYHHLTPLHLALNPIATVRGKEATIARLLIEKGAHIHARNSWDETPVHLATAFSESALWELLKNRGVKPTIFDLNGATPLHEAARHGNTEALKALLRKCKDPNPQLEGDITVQRNGEIITLVREGGTPLDVSVAFSHKEAAQILRNAGGKSRD